MWIGSRPQACVDTAMPASVCVWNTQFAASAPGRSAMWIALWITKPANSSTALKRKPPK